MSKKFNLGIGFHYGRANCVDCGKRSTEEVQYSENTYTTDRYGDYRCHDCAIKNREAKEIARKNGWDKSNKNGSWRK